MTTPRAERITTIQKQANEMLTEMARGIGAFKPLGRMSEVAMIVGARPRRGVAVDIAGQVWVFAKNRCPTASQVATWEAMQAQVQTLYSEQARLANFAIIGLHRTIGNRVYLERSQKLEAEGWLTPEESAFMRSLEAFWEAYPTAKGGVVTEQGIRPH